MRLLVGTSMVNLVAACGGGGGGAVQAAPTELRAAGDRTSASGDQLCAELLLVSGFARSPLHPVFALADVQLAQRLGRLALDHLNSTGLGAGTGPELAGSQRIRRLALLPSARGDENLNGRNWDEVLSAERERIVAAAGAVPLPGTAQAFLPWRHASTLLNGALGPQAAEQPGTWRTQREGAATVALADVGSVMTARALAAGQLLATSRGTLLGASATDGRLGLELVQQLLAAEETLFGKLFTDGFQMGALADPGTYDPGNGLYWLPAEVAVDFDQFLTSAPSAYRSLDRSSDLLAQARLLRASAELAWLAADGNPHPTLHALFRGHPFVEAQPPGSTGPLSWDEHIRPLLQQRCSGCHTGSGAQNGFVVTTMQQMLRGGIRIQASQLPMVVPGDHATSMLWRVLTGPPAPFVRMPFQSSMPPAEIQRIADWIDQGAREHPPGLPAPPRPGEVMAKVLFSNLVLLHFDRATGALHHRYEVRRSGIATAQATGAALEALAALARALPDLQYTGLRPQDVLAQAAAFAATSFADAEGRVLSDLTFANLAGGGPPGALEDQAALSSGMLAAVPFGNAAVGAAARAMTERLLASYWQPALGVFRQVEGYEGARFEPEVLANVIAALRQASAMNLPGAASVLDALLLRCYPLLSPAEWGSGGEVLGDGIPDTDGNGVPEPALAGGQHGQLPMLGRALLIGSDAQQPPPPSQATWSGHVRPLFLLMCGSCHMNGNQNGDYRLDTVVDLFVPGQSGGVYLPMVVPRDPERSLLYRKLADRLPPVGEQMPLQGPPLDASNLALVRRWIEGGATHR